jgi:hypothetical protein
MNSRIISSIKDLPKNCKYSKISSRILLYCTSSDLPDAIIKNSFQVSEIQIQSNNLTICSHNCENISLYRNDNSFQASFTINEIIEIDLAYELLVKICEQLTFNLFEHVYNPNFGVPYFYVETMDINIEYGEHINSCNIKCFNLYGKCEGLFNNTIKLKLVKLNSSSHIQEKIQLFLKAIKSNDLNGKFLRLYHFIDSIKASTYYKAEKKAYEKKYSKEYPSHLICDILIRNGITKIESTHKQTANINPTMIFQIISLRNDIAHSFINDSKIEEVLYSKLLPIVKQIVHHDSDLWV